MIGIEVVKYLRGIVAVADLVGDRVHCDRRPEGTDLPAIIVSVIGGNPDYSLHGEIGDISKIIQVDVYGLKRIDVDAICEAVRLAPLSGYRGTMVDLFIHAVLIENEIDMAEPPVDSSANYIFRQSTTYRITYNRTVT